MPVVVRASGMPELIRLKEVRSVSCIRDERVKVASLHPLIHLVQRNKLQVQIDTDRSHLALHLERQPLQRCFWKQARQPVSRFYRPRLIVKAGKLRAVGPVVWRHWTDSGRSVSLEDAADQGCPIDRRIQLAPE